MPAPGKAYSEPPSTALGASVQMRADKAHEDYHKTAKKLDAKPGKHAAATGPVETEIDSYNSGRVSGFVVGAFGDITMQVRDHANPVACELNAKHLALFDDAMNESKQMFIQRIHRSIGLSYTADGPDCFSADSVTLPRTHGSRVLTHVKQMRATPRHMSTFISTRLAAGAAITAPARARGLLD